MKIGLVGSHGVGKSSLVKLWLAKHPEYFTPVEESRKVVAKGLGINFETSIESQQAFSDALMDILWEIQNKDAITSRTLIDLCAYNLYFFRRAKHRLTQEFVDKCRDNMLRSVEAQGWDLFVYCPIMWELKDENAFRVGQKDHPEYQSEVDSYVFALLANYKIPYITLTSTNDDERIAQIETAVKERKSNGFVHV